MPRHGVDGWVLEDMDWDPKTGLSTFEYSSTTGEPNAFEVRPQPTHEGHEQWQARNRPPDTLTIQN